MRPAIHRLEEERRPKSDSTIAQTRTPSFAYCERLRSASSNNSSSIMVREHLKLVRVRLLSGAGKSVMLRMAAARRIPRVPVTGIPWRSASARPSASSISSRTGEWRTSASASNIAAPSPSSRCGSSSLESGVGRSQSSEEGRQPRLLGFRCIRIAQLSRNSVREKDSAIESSEQVHFTDANQIVDR